MTCVFRNTLAASPLYEGRPAVAAAVAAGAPDARRGRQTGTKGVVTKGVVTNSVNFAQI